MVRSIFIILKLIELLVFVLVGRPISKIKTSSGYWKIASVAIVLFAIIEGLRYNRMPDYMAYDFRFNHNNSLFEEGVDPLFSVICYTMNSIGLGFPIFLILQCGLFMYSCFLILKPYRRYAKYTLPLLLPLIIMNEQFIRWYLSMAFFLISFYHYLRFIHKYRTIDGSRLSKRIKRLKKKHFSLFVLFLLFSFWTHPAVAILVPFFFLIPVINKFSLPYYITIPAYVFVVWFCNIQSMTILIDMANLVLQSNLMDSSNNMYGHLSNVESLIEGEYLDMGISRVSISQVIQKMLCYFPLMFFGSKFYKKNNPGYGQAFYWLFFIAAIADPIASQVELLGRFTMTLEVMGFIGVGIVYNQMISFYRKNKLYECMLILSLFMFMYPIISYILTRPSDLEMLFIWNK